MTRGWYDFLQKKLGKKKVDETVVVIRNWQKKNMLTFSLRAIVDGFRGETIDSHHGQFFEEARDAFENRRKQTGVTGMHGRNGPFGHSDSEDFSSSYEE